METIERDEVRLDTGLAYAEGEPVLVTIRRRGRRYDLSGWREAAATTVGALGPNLTQTGVVSVPAVEGGVDRDWLARRVAEASLAGYDALLELE